MTHLKTLTLGAAVAAATFGFAVVAPANADTTMKSHTETTTMKTGETPQFSAIDKDANGKISAVEFSSAIEADTSMETFAELDTNGDGTLSEAEFDVVASVDTNTGLYKK